MIINIKKKVISVEEPVSVKPQKYRCKCEKEKKNRESKKPELEMRYAEEEEEGQLRVNVVGRKSEITGRWRAGVAARPVSHRTQGEEEGSGSGSGWG